MFIDKLKRLFVIETEIENHLDVWLTVFYMFLLQMLAIYVNNFWQSVVAFVTFFDELVNVRN